MSDEKDKIDDKVEDIEEKKKKLDLDYIKEKGKYVLELAKSNKLITAIIIITIGVFFISSSIMSGFNGKDRLVDNFNKAMINKDVNKLKKYIVSSEDSLKIEDKDIKNLLYYIDKHPFYIKSITKSLYEQSREINIKDHYTFELVKSGKSFFLFDKYRIKLNPSFITIHTNYKDTEIYINRKKVGKSSENDYSKEYGPFIPNIHEIKVVYKDKYTNIDRIENLNGFTINNDKLYIDISPDGEYISLASNVKNVSLYINGKDTGLVISNSLEYGPVPLDGSVKMYASKKIKDKDLKSKEVKVKSTHIYLPIDK